VSGGELPLEVLLNGVFWLWLLALVPAAVVTVAKGRLLLFYTGWITLGITWLIGAAFLADPDTPWARWFYSDERKARAGDPVRHRRRSRVTAAWIATALAALLVVGFFASRPTPILGVDGSALQYSVGGPLVPSALPCERLAADLYRCLAMDEEGSSTVSYEVKTRRLGCWTAIYVNARGSREPRTRFSGCVTIWDRLRLLDGLL
jgi:hypothetical protein